MIIHNFRCSSCGHTDEYYLDKYDDIVTCRSCNSSNVAKVFVKSTVEGQSFKPRFVDIDVNPVYVKNKKHLKDELNKRGLRSFYTHS